MGPDELRVEEARVLVVLSNRGKTYKLDGTEKSRGGRLRPYSQGNMPEIRDGLGQSKVCRGTEMANKDVQVIH